jgi:hypothetical protein
MKELNQVGAPEEKQNDKYLIAWQRKLLPWMVILPTILILVFIYLATSQLNDFSSEINNYKTSELDKLFLNAKDSSLRIPVETNKEEFVKLYMLAKMDEQLMNKRYSQGGALLVSRLYTKYLGFFTGMILAIVGAVFIISKLKENTSQLETSSEAFKLSLMSSSPGIIFGILGTCLMMTTILKQNDIDIKDVATYLNASMYQTNKVLVEDSKPVPDIDTLMEHSSPYNK